MPRRPVALGVCLAVVAAVIALSACGGGTSGPSLAPLMRGAAGNQARKKVRRAACSSVVDSQGVTYSVAHLGGGSNITVDYSTIPCTVGIYISSAHTPNTLMMTLVNGPFPIGVYFDNAGTGATQNQVNICANGSTAQGFNGPCVLGGSAHSPGSALYIRNTPTIHVDHTNIDSYVAGFVVLPCPNANNNFTDDHTSITSTTYPWTFMGGTWNIQHATPPPPSNGDCSGANVGSGNAPPGKFTEYPIPTASSQPWQIAAGSDSALWFTEFLGNKIGRITTSGTITEYTVPTRFASPYGIAAGSDGALWFTEFDADKIGRISTSGAFNEYALPRGTTPYLIAPGYDGALWFTEVGVDEIGRITTAGAITQFTSLAGTTFPVAIVSGPDSAMWFTAVKNSFIGRLTSAGPASGFAVSSNPYLTAITSGPDSALWFAANTTVNGAGELGRITTAGSITNLFAANTSSNFAYLAVGSDNNFWISDFGNNSIDNATTAGAYTYYTVPTAASYPTGITPGSDKAIWFVETDGNKVGRVTTGASPTLRRGGRSPGLCGRRANCKGHDR